jgi:PKD repeat protein
MKMEFLKKSLSINVIVSFVCLLSASFLQAQSTTGWILKSNEQGVKFLFKVDTCVTGNVVFFQFENTNNNPVTVNYHVIINGITTDVPLPQSIALEANEIIAGQCQGTPALSRATDNPANPILNFSMNIQN